MMVFGADRPTLDQTLMATARTWQERSTCIRNQVGAIIAVNGRGVISGYNGAPAGMPHCQHPDFRPARRIGDGLNPIGGSACRIAIHAEANAISYAARNGISVGDGTIYTTLSPCYGCCQLIISAGLTRVVYDRPYRDGAGLSLLATAGICVDRI